MIVALLSVCMSADVISVSPKRVTSASSSLSSALGAMAQPLSVGGCRARRAIARDALD